MIRIAIASLALLTGPALAQDYQPAPAEMAPTGIEAQPLPAPPDVPQSTGPVSLAPPPTADQTQAMPVSPHEGPEEKALDQSLGLPTTYVPADSAPAVKPSPTEDAAIEARINAVAQGRVPPPAVPAAPVSAPVAPPPTQTIYAPPTEPMNVAPAPSHWEGPEERALDQAVPGTGEVAPQGLPETVPQIDDPEVRRLNGGN